MATTYKDYFTSFKRMNDQTLLGGKPTAYFVDSETGPAVNTAQQKMAEDFEESNSRPDDYQDEQETAYVEGPAQQNFFDIFNFPTKPGVEDIPGAESPAPSTPSNAPTENIGLAYKPGNAMDNAMYIMDFLIKRGGFTPKQAAGFTANWFAESKCNPGAYNKKEKAGTFKGSSANGPGYGAGLAQWSHSWKTDLQRMMGRRDPIENWSMNTQLEAFLLDLEKGNKSKFRNLLSKNDSLTEAVDKVLRGYENGGNGTLASAQAMNKYTWAGGYSGLLKTRTDLAKQIYAKYMTAKS